MNLMLLTVLFTVKLLCIQLTLCSPIVLPSTVTSLSTNSPQSSLSSSSSSSSISSQSQSSTHSSSSHERTMLITQKWLIDNINLLRREMNEMARDYNQHVDSSKQEEIRKETEFIRDVASLRADHTLLARNQMQIINLIKGKPVLSGNHESNQQSNEIEQQSSSSETDSTEAIPHHRHRPKHLRHLIFDLMKEESSFQGETKRNMTSMAAEVSALHDITLTLYNDLKNLKKKVNIIEEDQV